MAVRRSLGVILVAVAWHCGINVPTIVCMGLVLLLVVFVVLPFLFRCCPYIQRHLIFLPWVNWPKHVNFNCPQDEGLEGARNFYLETSQNVEVGVWHIVPQVLVNQSRHKDRYWFERSLSLGHPIIVYLHGNTGSRAREHRIALYLILQKLNYHVVCFDYRGYADSSAVMPTMSGVVKDALQVYLHVKQLAGNSPVIVYGHSLGTAVSCESVYQLCQQGKAPSALILESPFNNIQDEVRIHPMSFMWRKMPLFDYFFTAPLSENDIGFMSDKRISGILIPILILHAKDDVVVPFMLGQKLYDAAMRNRPDHAGPITFLPFEAERGLGHISIYSAEEFPRTVATFVQDSIS